jgi:hypothetical protein
MWRSILEENAKAAGNCASSLLGAPISHQSKYWPVVWLLEDLELKPEEGLFFALAIEQRHVDIEEAQQATYHVFSSRCLSSRGPRHAFRHTNALDVQKVDALNACHGQNVVTQARPNLFHASESHLWPMMIAKIAVGQRLERLQHL